MKNIGWKERLGSEKGDHNCDYQRGRTSDGGQDSFISSRSLRFPLCEFPPCTRQMGRSWVKCSRHTCRIMQGVNAKHIENPLPRVKQFALEELRSISSNEFPTVLGLRPRWISQVVVKPTSRKKRQCFPFILGFALF